jgi:predicted TIM-barrel fold metal-dependent hydrolase
VIVDFHCHLVPPDADGHVPPLLRDVEGFLQRKAEAGIDRVVVLNAMVNLPGARTDNRALDRVRRWNEFGLELAATHPDRVSTFVGLDPLGGPAQLEDARRAVEAGSSGLTINSSRHGVHLDAPALEEFWALACELGVPVFVHPAGEDTGAGSSDPRLAQFGTRAAEVGLSIAAAIFAGVLDRHPTLRLVAGAGGGGLASLAGRLDAAFHAGAIGAGPERPAFPAAPPSSYLRRIHVDSLLFSVPALRCALDVFGADRVLFGTDSPPAPTPPAVTWALLDRLGLDADVRAQVLGGNAARLLGLVSGPRPGALAAAAHDDRVPAGTQGS